MSLPDIFQLASMNYNTIMHPISQHCNDTCTSVSARKSKSMKMGATIVETKPHTLFHVPHKKKKRAGVNHGNPTKILKFY